MKNKADEVVKALRWIASNDEICFNAEQANIAADLLEQLKAENNQTAKDRDQWKVAAEASRDAIQPQLRDRISQLEAENEGLKASQPVRCKNCNEARKIDDYFWCEFFDVSHDGEDYCNCGERIVEE